MFSSEYISIYITLIIILIGIFLFVKEYFTIDTSSIIIMTLFIVTGILDYKEGLSGFTNSAPITIACMMVMSYAVLNSGLLKGFRDILVKIGKKNYALTLVVFCLVTAAFSAFINDSAVVAIMIPIVLQVSSKSNISASKLLLPVSFAAAMGGATTIIGTSANLVVSGYAEDNGLPGFEMFSFALPALIITSVGFVYLLFVAPFLLPKRNSLVEDMQKESNQFITEIIINEDSADIGKTISESILRQKYNVEIIEVNNLNNRKNKLEERWKLKANDHLKIVIHFNELNDIRHDNNYTLEDDKPLFSDVIEKNDKGNQLYEAIIPFGSKLAGKTLNDIKFRERYSANVLAVRNLKKNRFSNLGNFKLSEGNVLVVDSSAESFSEMIKHKMLFPLQEIASQKLDKRKAIISVLILVGVITAAAMGITSIVVAGMVGCLSLVVLNVLKPQEAYDTIDWKVIFMIAGVLSMGTALEKTGTSKIIAAFLATNLGNFDLHITLAFVYLVTLIATNILSGKAAAALMAPIAIQFAISMEVNYQPFLIAIMFACAYTFMTPICNPTNTMVYSPGNYTFKDYIKVGLPLNIIIWIVAVFVIPLFFPFK